MPAVQVELDVPLEIMKRIASGEYVLIGGVVRRVVGGQIVALLKPATDTAKAEEAAGRLAAVLRSRNTIAAAVVGTAVAGTAGALVVVNRRRRRARERKAPECVASFNAALDAYLSAGREKRLDAEIISHLIAELDAVKAYADSSESMVQFPTALWASLADLIADHTRKLADANSMELSELDATAEPSTDSNVIDLRHHLVAQRRIFTTVA